MPTCQKLNPGSQRPDTIMFFFFLIDPAPPEIYPLSLPDALPIFSAREVASSLLGEALLLAAAGAEPHRSGNDHPRMAPHGVYPAAGEDRWVAIAVASDAEWQALDRKSTRLNSSHSQISYAVFCLK